MNKINMENQNAKNWVNEPKPFALREEDITSLKEKINMEDPNAKNWVNGSKNSISQDAKRAIMKNISSIRDLATSSNPSASAKFIP